MLLLPAAILVLASSPATRGFPSPGHLITDSKSQHVVQTSGHGSVVGFQNGNTRAALQEQRLQTHLSPHGQHQNVWKGTGQVTSVTSDNFGSSGPGAIINSRQATSGVKTGPGGVLSEARQNQFGQSYLNAAGTGSGLASGSGNVHQSGTGWQPGGSQDADKQVAQASSNAQSQSAMKGNSGITLKQHSRNDAQLGRDQVQQLPVTENSVPGPVIAPVPVTGPVGVSGGVLGRAPGQW